MNHSNWRKIEWTVGVFVLLFCVGVALTQPVNSRPHDYWFHSQTRILERSVGNDNYTPVGAPAFLYAANHLMARAIGWDLAGEFYLASFLHHILLFLSGLLLYLSHRYLGLRKSGLAVSVLLVVFLESTLLPQVPLSENVVVFLMTAVLFAGIHLLVNRHGGCPRQAHDGKHKPLTALMFTARAFRRNPGPGGGRLTGLAVLLGLLLGAVVITRVVPVLVLPALVLLWWCVLPRDQAVRFAAAATATVLFVVLGAMSMNVYRYGRFELSNSVGRHLWNAITPRADAMLADSEQYRLLKAAVPDIQGKSWWEVPSPSEIAGLENYSPEGLLKKLAVDAISAHPLAFLDEGVGDTWSTLRSCPDRLGLQWAPYYNPLNRTTMLPAIAGPWPVLDFLLRAVHGGVHRIYAPVVVGTLLLGFAVFLADTLAPVRSGPSLVRRVWLFSTGLFLSCFYVSCQIEMAGNNRFVVPYLPLLALSTSTAIALLGVRFGKRRTAPPPLPDETGQ